VRAINWIRGRQESKELSYWLSFVYLDPKDRSFTGRIYLVYVMVFFTIWWFIVIAWFAEAGAFLLQAIRPADPVSLAVVLELSVLLIWFVVHLILSLRRSPVKFSGEDSYLICQMPVSPQWLVLRWMVLPWVKNLLPFLLFTVVLAFSVANTGLGLGEMTGQMFFEYFRVGLRSMLVIVPIHLALYTLNWALGIWAMKTGRKTATLLLSSLFLLIVVAAMIAGIAGWLCFEFTGFLSVVTMAVPEMLSTGLSTGPLTGPLIGAWAVVAGALGVLFFTADKFSPGSAAEETKSELLIRNLRRYGFGDQAREKKLEKRLGLSRRWAWQPAWGDAGALVWKDIVQTGRRINLGTIFTLLTFFSTAVGLVFLPSLGGRMLLILTWTLQASKFLSNRFRQDLAHWAIFRQLSVDHQKLIRADLAFSGVVILLGSVIGVTVGAALSGQPIWDGLLTWPGMIAAVAGVSMVVILRHARIDLLMAGQAPGVSEFSVLGGTICAAIPVAIYTLLPGLVGTIIGCASSLLIGFLALRAADGAYRTIGL
jgi:hypothetical protein